MKELEPYFNLFKGKEDLYSKMGVAKHAVNVLIFDGRLVAQKRLWDKDEMIIPCKNIRGRESPDIGIFDSDGKKL